MFGIFMDDDPLTDKRRWHKGDGYLAFIDENNCEEKGSRVIINRRCVGSMADALSYGNAAAYQENCLRNDSEIRRSFSCKYGKTSVRVTDGMIAGSLVLDDKSRIPGFAAPSPKRFADDFAPELELTDCGHSSPDFR